MPVNVVVKVAADYPLLQTASGRVLLAWQSNTIATHWIATAEKSISKKKMAATLDRMEAIRSRGYELSQSDFVHGLTDISCPVLDADGVALAALTVAYLQPMKTVAKIDDVIPLVKDSAKAIASNIIGDLR